MLALFPNRTDPSRGVLSEWKSGPVLAATLERTEPGDFSLRGHARDLKWSLNFLNGILNFY
jgi:hypothetical protein